MRLMRLMFPIVVVAVAVVAVSATAGLISAAYYAPNLVEQPVETDGTPQEPEPEPTLTPTPKLELDIELQNIELEVVPLAEGYKFDSGPADIPSSQGDVYTWEDGDRTMRAVLQNDVVVQDNYAITAQDDIVRKGTTNSIVRRQYWHGRESGPVFRPESGSGLMTLPGGVLLALNPEWDREAVEAFFEENGISLAGATELDFMRNGFLVDTASGFAPLEVANRLAVQEGVVAASPNWAREAELK